MTHTQLALFISAAAIAIALSVLWEQFDRKSRELRRAVRDNLDSALSGGYFQFGEHLAGATAEDIAHDLRVYAEDMEPYDAKALTPHVQAWLDDRKHRLEFELANWSSGLP